MRFLAPSNYRLDLGVIPLCGSNFLPLYFAVFALAKLMNLKEDESQLSAIARSFLFNDVRIIGCWQLSLKFELLLHR